MRSVRKRGQLSDFDGETMKRTVPVVIWVRLGELYQLVRKEELDEIREQTVSWWETTKEGSKYQVG